MAVILGIDPGSRICGYGLIKAQGNKVEYVACGCIRVPAKAFPERLQIIHENITEIIERYQPDEVAVENVFVGRGAQSSLKLGQARGAAIVACTNQSLPVAEYAPKRVKQAVTGQGQADKKQMQHMITSLLALSSVPQEDAADALCIAVCHANTQAALIRMSGTKSIRHGRLSDIAN